MAVFEVLWPNLLITKLRCFQKNNFGHTNEQYELSMYSFQLAWYVSFLLQKPVHKSLNIDDIPPRFSKNLKFVCFIGNC